MKIEIKNQDIILRLMKEKREAIAREMPQAISDAATEIIVRTQQGVDANGAPFAPYTPPYNRFKGKFKSGFITRTGKRGKLAGQVKGEFSVTPQKPDLLLSGNMLAAVQTDVTVEPGKITGRIYFNSLLESLKAQGNMAKRLFFRLSKDQIQRITARLKSAK